MRGMGGAFSHTGAGSDRGNDSEHLFPGFGLVDFESILEGCDTSGEGPGFVGEIEHGIAAREHLGDNGGSGEPCGGKADIGGGDRAACAEEHGSHAREVHELARKPFAQIRPDGSEVAEAIGERFRGKVFCARFGEGQRQEGGIREERSDELFAFFPRRIGRERVRDGSGREFVFEKGDVEGEGAEGSEGDEVSMRRLATGCGHCPCLGEQVFGAFARAFGACEGGGGAGGEESGKEVFGSVGIALGEFFWVDCPIGHTVLKDIPSLPVDWIGFGDRFGEEPIGAGGKFSEKVSVTGGAGFQRSVEDTGGIGVDEDGCERGWRGILEERQGGELVGQEGRREGIGIGNGHIDGVGASGDGRGEFCEIGEATAADCEDCPFRLFREGGQGIEDFGLRGGGEGGFAFEDAGFGDGDVCVSEFAVDFAACEIPGVEICDNQGRGFGRKVFAKAF